MTIPDGGTPDVAGPEIPDPANINPDETKSKRVIPKTKTVWGGWLVLCGIGVLIAVGVETYNHNEGRISLSSFFDHAMDSHGIMAALSMVMMGLGLTNLFPDALMMMAGLLKQGGQTKLATGTVMTVAAMAPLTTATTGDKDGDHVDAGGPIAAVVSAATAEHYAQVALALERLKQLEPLPTQSAEVLGIIERWPSEPPPMQVTLSLGDQIEQMDRHLVSRFDSVERQLSEIRTRNTDQLVAGLRDEISSQVTGPNGQICRLISAIRAANNDGTLNARLASLEGQMGSLRFYEEELAGRNAVARVADFFTGRNLKLKQENAIQANGGTSAQDGPTTLVAETDPAVLAAIAPAAGPAC